MDLHCYYPLRTINSIDPHSTPLHIYIDHFILLYKWIINWFREEVYKRCLQAQLPEHVLQNQSAELLRMLPCKFSTYTVQPNPSVQIYV